jgi:HEAT repeat protein
LEGAIRAIDAILKSKVKPKDKTARLAESLKRGETTIRELVEFFATGSASERGTCMEAFEAITRDDPQSAEGVLDFVIARLGDKAPRVKWEASRVIANSARARPKGVTAALPALLKNTRDEGTVVRWSTAFALTEIALHVPETRKQLRPVMTRLARDEEGGVKKVYAQGLKKLEQQTAS